MSTKITTIVFIFDCALGTFSMILMKIINKEPKQFDELANYDLFRGGVGTLMSHFLFSITIPILTICMIAAPLGRILVSSGRTSIVFTPLSMGTFPGAVYLSPITVTAYLNLF